MAVLTKKIPASSLLEVTVGMVLISMVIGFALMIFTNVSLSTTHLSKLHYQLVLQDMAQETIRNQTFHNETQQDEVVTIQKTVHQYPNTTGAWLIELEATRADQVTVATYKTIAYDPAY